MSKEQEKGAGPKGVRRNVTADDRTRRGVYSNEGIVSHGREEFALDFCFFSALDPMRGQLVSRVILSPAHAKRLAMALQENIRRYEERFGEIAVRPRPPAEEEPPIVQ